MRIKSDGEAVETAGQSTGIAARRRLIATIEGGGPPGAVVPRLNETYIENRDRIQPHQANNYGTAHGGEVMHLMDEVGAMSAMRFAGETCVTAAVDGLAFESPIPIGDIALVEAYAFDAGRTSVRVSVRVRSEDPLTGDSELTNTSTFVFVAVDETMSPVPVPELVVKSERERELQARARDR